MAAAGVEDISLERGRLRVVLATIAAGSTCTLQAVAFKSGYNTSPVASGSFDRTDPNGGGNGPQHGGQGQRASNQTTSARVVNYALDNCGNRTNVNDGGVDKSYVPNNLNQYSTGHGSAVTNGDSHEISAYGGTSYDYVGDTYLAKATSGSNTYTLYYDALGRCVKRTAVISGVTSTNYYIFDGEHWVMEYNGDGSVAGSALYGRGMDELISRGITGVGGYFYFPDRNGNISLVTDGGNLMRESYRYDAFGLPTVKNAAGTVLTSSAINNKFMFTGREWNPAFGFYEYRARAYNPTIGRFMSEDPKGFDAGDYSLYRYCANDPMDLSDPMGLYAMDTGWTQSLWNIFNKAQQAAANSAAAATERIDKALADPKGNASTTKAFEKVFGKGSATAANMSKVSENLKAMVTALRDDGSLGYKANAYESKGSDAGEGKLNGKVISINTAHSSFRIFSGLAWTALHESGHNAGLFHAGGKNGEYKSYNGLESAAYENLPTTDRLRNPDNYCDFAR